MLKTKIKKNSYFNVKSKMKNVNDDSYSTFILIRRLLSIVLPRISTILFQRSVIVIPSLEKVSKDCLHFSLYQRVPNGSILHYQNPLNFSQNRTIIVFLVDD